MSEQRVPDPVVNASRKGGLEIYGPGTDGDVTVISNIVLNRDMFYNNLTVAANCSIDTNGYRIFVKDTLNMLDSTSVIGRLSNTATTGTLLGGAISGVKASDTLGGSGGLNPGENLFAETEFYNFSQAIVALKFDASQNKVRVLMGGSGGTPGNQGAKGADGTASPAGSGSPGNAGSPGNRPGFENSVGSPGGRGFPGNAGSPGNIGSGGIGGAGGAAGLGGVGGGVVVVSARFIVGSGIIRADGQSPSQPGSGQPGAPGSAGNPGASGNPGSKAPDFFQFSYSYVASTGFTQTYPVQYTIPDSYLYFTQTNFAQYVYYSQWAEFFSQTVPGNQWWIAPSGGNDVFRTAFGWNPGRFTVITNPGRTLFNPPNFGQNPGRVIRVSPRFVYFVPGNPYVIPGRSYFVPGNREVRYIDGNPFSYEQYVRTNPFVAGRYGYNAPFTRWITRYGYFTDYGYNTTSRQVQYISPGRFAYNIESRTFNPTVVFEPSVYHQGGAGGTGGAGGAGGSVTAGLPGAPGTAGYAGGGGVVLLMTERDVPSTIDVRAAAGTGGNGQATAGTVIIIKNEEDNK